SGHRSDADVDAAIAPEIPQPLAPITLFFETCTEGHIMRPRRRAIAPSVSPRTPASGPRAGPCIHQDSREFAPAWACAVRSLAGMLPQGRMPSSSEPDAANRKLIRIDGLVPTLPAR